MPEETPGAPPNLPIDSAGGEVAPAAQPAALPGDTEDIFADLESGASAPHEVASGQPAHANEPIITAPVHGTIDHGGGLELEEDGGGRKKLLIIVVVALLVIVGGVVAAWRFGWLSSDKSKNLVPETPATVPPDNEQELPVDADFDGLSDAQEQELGTDSKKPDTDDDGLFDRDEVKVYKTDPLNPDSDTDGFNDGDEVKNGFDPSKGDRARLFEFPTAQPQPTPSAPPLP